MSERSFPCAGICDGEYDLAPRLVFRIAAGYLSESGWTRDGDDKGMWRQGNRGQWFTLGEAFMEQLEQDGVRMQEESPGAA